LTSRNTFNIICWRYFLLFYFFYFWNYIKQKKETSKGSTSIATKSINFCSEKLEMIGKNSLLVSDLKETKKRKW